MICKKGAHNKKTVSSKNFGAILKTLTQSRQDAKFFCEKAHLGQFSKPV